MVVYFLLKVALASLSSAGPTRNILTNQVHINEELNELLTQSCPRKFYTFCAFKWTIYTISHNQKCKD